MADFEIERPSVDVQPIQPTYNINTPSFTIEINGGTPGQRGEQGPPGQDGRDGIDGINGIDGTDGVGVESIEQTSTSHESGGTNIITATLTDGSQSFFEIMNGEAGQGSAALQSPVDVFSLADGIYKLPENCYLYGVETTITGGGLLSVTHKIVDGVDIASFFVLEDNNQFIVEPGHQEGDVYYAGNEYPNILNMRVIYGEVCDETGDAHSSNFFNVLTGREIADNLTTNDATKVLSAKQGKLLRDLLDGVLWWSAYQTINDPNYHGEVRDGEYRVVKEPFLYEDDTIDYYINSETIMHQDSNNNWTKLNDVIDSKQNEITAQNKLDYSLISNTPTIPTVNDATLTIQKNGSNLGTFTANASVNKSINITVPTKVSDITNDSGFVTSTNVSNTITASGYATKTDPVLGTIEVVNYAKRYGGTNYAYINSGAVVHKDSNNNLDTLDNVIDSKQETLVSGTNIKTINNQSILGPGNIDVSGGGSTPTDVRVNGTSITSNDVADIQVDGTYDSSNNKIATMSSLPTKVSDLSNDTGFITNTVNNLTNYYTKTNTYTKSEVDSLISAVSTMDIQVVQTLPTQDISTTTIYLVPKTASTNDAYDEYIYVNNNWEHIGSTEVDLSNYYTKTETDNLLDDKADLTDIQNDKSIARGVEYIIGTQTAATNLWTGVSTDTGCSSGTLYTGKVIIYHLPQAGSSSAATLNLTLPDGTTTGAKSVYRLASTTTTTNFVAGCDILMVYDGAHWKVNAYVDTSGSNTIGYQLRTNSAIFKNKTGYTMNRYTLLFEVDGGLSGAATTIATGTTKTTVPFKYIPGGVIKYYSVSGSIANNANFTATGLWDQYTLNLGYTFNTGSTLTSGKPVYMRCVVNSDGTLTPNYAGSPSHPIVQDLPTTEDGYVYVYLGQAYNTTNIELMYMHPIYEYKNGKIREYVDAAGGTVTETDPVFTASAAYGISSSDITTWNNKSDFSGNYNDLTNKPTIPTVPTTVSSFTNDAGYITSSYHDSSKQDTLVSGTNIKTINNTSLLGSGNITIGGGGTATDVQINGSSIVSSNVANILVDGIYSSSNKIATMAAIPTATSDLTNDSGFITSSYHDSTKQDLINSSNKLDYSLLSNTPTIPTQTSQLTNNSGYITNSVNNLTNYTLTSALATVATSGSYNDLSNKPTIPTITLSTTTWVDSLF